MFLNSSAPNSSNINYCYAVRLQAAIAVSAIKIILVAPICASVLCLGHQRWRQQHSRRAVSHSDMFAYHLAAMELLWVPCSFGFASGYYANLVWTETIAYSASCITIFGEAFFHILTCLERYLAVVHPVTYLGLKNGRVRNISIGCAWLLSFGLSGLTHPHQPDFPIITIIFFSACSLVVIAFCNLSILHILIQPRPGDGGGETARVEQSKLRAFHTITAIMVVLCLWFAGFIAAMSFARSGLLSRHVSCVLGSTINSYNLPSCLVLPLLYLQRAGKLPFCNYKKTRK